MIENQVAKTLHDGLDRLRARGLAKFTPCDEQGRVCARGALMGADRNTAGCPNRASAFLTAPFQFSHEMVTP